jgi:hypothetical protein
VTHALAVLDRKVKEGGQRAEIGDKAVDCTRVASAVLALEVGRAGIGDPTASSPGGAWMSLKIAQ